MKIENNALTASYRRYGPCRWCGHECNLCGAHLFAKGHNGGRQIDLPVNLVALGMNPLVDCTCHFDSHHGERPIMEDLLAVSAADHDCQQDDIVDLIRLVQRMPKFNEMTAARYELIIGRELGYSARCLAMSQLESFRHLLVRAA